MLLGEDIRRIWTLLNRTWRNTTSKKPLQWVMHLVPWLGSTRQLLRLLLRSRYVPPPLTLSFANVLTLL